MAFNLLEHTAVIDMFCGVGGMTHGFVKQRFNVIAGIDTDESCRYAFEKNNKAAFIKKDILEVSSNEINELFSNAKYKILIGCAPCQPFSKYTNKKSHDSKWSLLYNFANIINETHPEIVSMENVPELINFQRKPVFEDFVESLRKGGYFVSSSLVYCPDYGVPQTRTRLVLLASKFGEIELVKPSHTPKRYRTVRDAISGLEPIEAAGVGTTDPLHRSAGLSELNLTRIKNTPEGGGWRDWSKELILECHKKETGKTFPSVYGRMKWDDLAPTITTQCMGYGNGRFGHPEQDRAISLREAALLQSFPKNYEFIEPDKDVFIGTIARHIGNAVPVRLGRAIARSIKKHLEMVHV